MLDGEAGSPVPVVSLPGRRASLETCVKKFSRKPRPENTPKSAEPANAESGI